jgi:hypothetical protein
MLATKPKQIPSFACRLRIGMTRGGGGVANLLERVRRESCGDAFLRLATKTFTAGIRYRGWGPFGFVQGRLFDSVKHSLRERLTALRKTWELVGSF